MRRIATVGVLAGVGVLVVRAVLPKLKLHERAMAACEGMFEQMPEDFPPKRMMSGIEEIRENSARTLQLLEERKDKPLGDVQPEEVGAPHA